MDRVILHSDANSFYASVEHLYHPELKQKAIAVGGDPKERHGIILTADTLAKRCGVTTGMAIWQAYQVCPDLIILPAKMDRYLRFSRMLQEIYSDYTDLQEPFGLDESWLDVTDSVRLKGNGYQIAEEIRKRVRNELGITVSIGISFNKIFAKLGSDYKKPDAVTTMYREEFRKKAWNLPVSDLLYVGPSTKRKLHSVGIMTIGDLALTDPLYLQHILGKMGYMLWCFANGYDDSPVKKEYTHAPIKSIGNSTTSPRDLNTDEDVKIILYVLAESVSARLRENGFRCRTVEISIRENTLISFTRQCKLEHATDITSEIAQNAYRLFQKNYSWEHPIRSLGIRGLDLVNEQYCEQLHLFSNIEIREKQKKAELAVDEIRRRFGYNSVQRGLVYQDKILSKSNMKEDHKVHPHTYFG